jgi:hypothetical protein
MNTNISEVPMITVMGVRDFLNDPDWASVAFLESPVGWLIGLLLALAIVGALIYLAILIFKLVGADRNKAKYVGESALVAIGVIFLAWTFQDFIGTFIGSLGGSRTG